MKILLFNSPYRIQVYSPIAGVRIAASCASGSVTGSVGNNADSRRPLGDDERVPGNTTEMLRWKRLILVVKIEFV